MRRGPDMGRDGLGTMRDALHGVAWRYVAANRRITLLERER